MVSELTRAPDEAASALRQIGRELRDARLARGEDLRDIAAFLCIRPDHLAALENGDLAGTPGRVYALGFLRSYADRLGLDGDLLVAWLKASFQVAGPPAPSPRTGRAMYAAALAVLLLAGASVVAYRAMAPELPRSYPKEGRAPSPVAADIAVPAREPIDVASAAAARPTALDVLAVRDGEDAAIGSAPGPGTRVVLLGRTDGWIQLRSGDRSFVRSRTLATGQRLGLLARPDLLLWPATAVASRCWSTAPALARRELLVLLYATCLCRRVAGHAPAPLAAEACGWSLAGPYPGLLGVEADKIASWWL
jgi:cytoskeleton protein RodZ